VRVAGLGDVVTDQGPKEKLFAHTDFLADYWEGADDPSYALIQIIPVEVEYMRPGDMDAQRFGV
jgi:general stress protein 26